MKMSLDIIHAAKSGDPTAIKQILAQYDSYINTLSEVDELDEKGNTVRRFDPDVKHELQQALILALGKFEIGRKSSK